MHRIHVSPTPLCPCGLGEQTSRHVLQDCPDFCEIRKRYWPTEVSFAQKLYGNREDLQTTIGFILETKMTV
ncbi:hypothetical protein BsWGS_09827 [Bradybaena similaris]